jgi:hypothetical protein
MTTRQTDVAAPLTMGKYLISPLVKALENGWFASSVSIRSGSGSGTSDRVLRLTRIFRDRLEAADYARGEGLQWIGTPTPSLAAG